jgi:PPM family protein phosphatase
VSASRYFDLSHNDVQLPLLNDFLRYKPDATAEEIASIPQHVITRALGIQGEIEVALHHERAFPGDLYLLCTDGVHTMIDDDTIFRMLGNSTDLADVGKSLLDAALEAGGADNIAVVLVRCLAE